MRVTGEWQREAREVAEATLPNPNHAQAQSPLSPNLACAGDHTEQVLVRCGALPLQEGEMVGHDQQGHGRPQDGSEVVHDPQDRDEGQGGGCQAHHVG
jgi:hypothetical protein